MRIGTTATGRHWQVRDADQAVALAISQRHGLSEILGRVLALRGLTPDAVPRFLEPRLRDWLPDPSHLQDLDKAAHRLAMAIREGERVGIVGDYDVDGATSTALVVRYFRAFGIEPVVEIPDRLEEGYGASTLLLDRLAAEGCRLVLTLDNGTNAFDAIEHAAARGQEVIIIDHHTAEESLPAAFAVVNPNRMGQESPLKHLAACGVTFVVLVGVSRVLRTLAPELAGRIPDVMGWLDLVALGTVCDVVPLTGLNRAFVHQGLKVAARSTSIGIAALARAAAIDVVRDVWQFGFALGPRLNAGGRLGQSRLASLLLVTDDQEEAQPLADRLDALNLERQELERSLLEAADRAIQSQLDAGRRILVAEGEGWHVGVIGIVASRLVERYHRPVFVIGLEGAQGKGSARSVPGFDVGASVIAARQTGLLVKGGGHAMAAGLTIDSDRLPAFKAFMEERASDRTSAPAAPRVLALDGSVSVAGASTSLAGELERVAPFGAGNDEPRFHLADARIVERRPTNGGHLSCTFAGTAIGRLRAIAFRCQGMELGRMLLEADGPLQVAGRIKLDRWQGRSTPCFHIDDAATG